jgi:ubiquinone/menaquinone biosynthesis C-methylase UbiE
MDYTNKSNSHYILGTGGQGASNLDLQHKILKEESFAQLRQAGLAKNMVVWDIGCGSGVMTEYLAETVGAEGLVYALDVSEEQINVTKERIAAAVHSNIQSIVGDIITLDANQFKKADIVYSRLL